MKKHLLNLTFILSTFFNFKVLAEDIQTIIPFYIENGRCYLVWDVTETSEMAAYGPFYYNSEPKYKKATFYNYNAPFNNKQNNWDECRKLLDSCKQYYQLNLNAANAIWYKFLPADHDGFNDTLYKNPPSIVDTYLSARKIYSFFPKEESKGSVYFLPVDIKKGEVDLRSKIALPIEDVGDLSSTSAGKTLIKNLEDTFAAFTQP